MDTFEAIYRRRATRDFNKGRSIPEPVLRDILESATYAARTPDGVTPWRWIMVRDANTKELIAACAKELAMSTFGSSFEIFGRGHLWYLPKDIQLRIAENTTTGDLWQYPAEADAVLVPVLSTGGWVDTVTPFADDLEIISQFLGFASQNMWLAAHNYGVGAGFNAMPFSDARRREIESELLGVPNSWVASGAFCFGYAKAPRFFGPARPPLEGVAHSEYWGNPYVRLAFRGESPQGILPETDLMGVIKGLRFCRSFKPGKVPDWAIEKILDCALWGPQPENYKHFRFIVIKDADSKAFIESLVKEKVHCPWSFNYSELQYSRVRHLEENERLANIEEKYQRGLGGWIKQADTLIVVLSAFTNWRDHPYPTAGANPNTNRNVSVGCCTQNMMLAATALGLGVNYDVRAVGDRRTRDLLMEFLGAPGISWIPQGILGLGEIGEHEEATKRPELKEVLYEECWGNPAKSII